MQDTQHHDEQHHVPKSTYNNVFLILAFLTVLEVIVAELGLPDLLHIGGLLALTIAKGALVVAYYMHLKYDPPIYTFVFVVPLIMGTGVILSLQALAGY